MKPEYKQKRRKTFPLEIDDELHRALKHRAIESDQSLHSFIIEALSTRMQEDPAKYGITASGAGKKREAQL